MKRCTDVVIVRATTRSFDNDCVLVLFMALSVITF